MLGRLVGRHTAFIDLPFELRFHVDNHGLADLLNGRTTVEAFEERMRGKWYQRPDRKGGHRGLHRFLDEDALERNLEEFRRGFRLRPKRNARRLIDATIAAYLETREHDGQPWVDSTPYTMRGAGTLHALYPGAKFVHVVRDGRDVASSVTRRSWGPDDFREALAWWEERKAQADEGARQLPAGRLLEIRLEDLVVHERDQTYARLLEFLEVEDEPGIRSYFEEQMPARGAHLDRWRNDVPEDEHATVTKEYEAMLERLEARRP